MNRLIPCLVWLVVLGLLVGCKKSSVSSRRPALIAEDASPNLSVSRYIGQPVVDPESLSGVWEAEDGRGGAVGLELRLYTYLPGMATTFSDQAQTWQDFLVGVYERDAGPLRVGQTNYFSDHRNVGGVEYNQGHLRLHSGAFDLNLTHLAGDRWSGRLHQLSFDKDVMLKRSNVSKSQRKAWFVGTWRQRERSGTPACLHVAEQADGWIDAWYDTHQLGGLMRYSPHLMHPAFTFQSYGGRMDARLGTRGELLL